VLYADIAATRRPAARQSRHALSSVAIDRKIVDCCQVECIKALPAEATHGSRLGRRLNGFSRKVAVLF